MKNKLGFTLAEVLITLGIIGIVAALTIPTLIANTQSQRFRSQFKKTLSTLNQAVRMNVAQHDFDFAGSDSNCLDDESDNPAARKSICAVLNGGLKGHLATDYKFAYKSNPSGGDYLIEKPATEHDWFSGAPADYNRDNAGIQFLLSDGSFVVLNSGALVIEPDTGDVDIDYSCITSRQKAINDYISCGGFIDVNGSQLPNKEVQCSDPTKTTYIGSKTSSCTVNNKTMGDIFPVIFYNSTIEPSTNAGVYVLNSTK